MRVLCICQKGNSRSVVMAWLLRNQRRHDTIATGMVTASRRTRNMLYRWADLVILMAPQYRHWIPAKYDDKVMVCNVGRDKYFSPHDPRLLTMCEEFADKVEGL